MKQKRQGGGRILSSFADRRWITRTLDRSSRKNHYLFSLSVSSTAAYPAQGLAYSIVSTWRPDIFNISGYHGKLSMIIVSINPQHTPVRPGKGSRCGMYRPRWIVSSWHTQYAAKFSGSGVCMYPGLRAEYLFWSTRCGRGGEGGKVETYTVNSLIDRVQEAKSIVVLTSISRLLIVQARRPRVVEDTRAPDTA